MNLRVEVINGDDASRTNVYRYTQLYTHIYTQYIHTHTDSYIHTQAHNYTYTHIRTWLTVRASGPLNRYTQRRSVQWFSVYMYSVSRTYWLQSCNSAGKLIFLFTILKFPFSSLYFQNINVGDIYRLNIHTITLHGNLKL